MVRVIGLQFYLPSRRVSPSASVRNCTVWWQRHVCGRIAQVSCTGSRTCDLLQLSLLLPVTVEVSHPHATAVSWANGPDRRRVVGRNIIMSVPGDHCRPLVECVAPTAVRCDARQLWMDDAAARRWIRRTVARGCGPDRGRPVPCPSPPTKPPACGQPAIRPLFLVTWRRVALPYIRRRELHDEVGTSVWECVGMGCHAAWNTMWRPGGA